MSNKLFNWKLYEPFMQGVLSSYESVIGSKKGIKLSNFMKSNILEYFKIWNLRLFNGLFQNVIFNAEKYYSRVPAGAQHQILFKLASFLF